MKNKNEIRNIIILSEAVIDLIINNMISSVIRISNNRRIYKNINIHCFNYLIKFLEPCLLTTFLPHENISDLNSKYNELFYNKSLPHKDAWINITEPKLPILDRHINRTHITKPIKNNINVNNTIIKDNNLYKYNSESQSNKENKGLNNITKNNKNNEKKINNIEHEDIDNQKNNEFKDENNIKENINNIKENKFDFTDQNDNIYKNYKVLIKKRRHIKINNFGEKYIEEELDKLIEMPSFDILNSNESQNMNRKEEFNKLRKEYQNLRFKKSNENSIIFINKYRSGSKRLKSLLIKNFDNSRLTFDSNGKIINLHIPKLSNISSEFNSPKQKIVNGLFNNNLKRYNKILSLKNKKPTITSFSNHNFNINKEISKKNTVSNKDKDNDKIENNLNENYNIENIEYNPMDQKSSFYFNKYNFNKKKLIIGGENFDKIIPEVGVIIHNDYKKGQNKIGGFQYMSKYNRPSLNELSKILDNNGKFKSANNSFLSFNSENKELNSINYNGYNEEFNENNNPLFHNALSINNKDRTLSSFSYKKRNKYHNIKDKNYTIDINDRSNKKIFRRNLKSSFNHPSPSNWNSNDNIILSNNKKLNDIYRLLIDDENKILDDYSSNNNVNKSKKVISVKELIDLKRKLPLINDINKRKEKLMKGRKIINKFINNIMQNLDWGNSYILNNKESNKNSYSNIFKNEKFRKLKIIEENNNNFINNKNLLTRNIKKKKLFSSSSAALLP